MDQEISSLLRKPRDVTRDVAEIVRAPRRMLPAEAAAKYLRNDRGPWEPDLAPEMIEPLNLMGSRKYTGIVFVGPARSSKTMSLVHGALAYVVTCDPGDMLITHLSQDAARDFSRTEVDRVLRYSPDLAEKLSTRPRDDNTFDKYFRMGMALKIGWPAISQLSARTIKYVIFTDYDRPENRDDVDGEGPLWQLGQKRTETYMSRGKTLAESSPGEEIADANWKATTPHEAPPVSGILALYNRSTRARRYWPCKHQGCRQFFQAKPGVDPFNLPSFEECEKLVQTSDLMTLAEKYARVHCPHCGGEHRMEDRADMKRRGVWLHEGETVDLNGKVTGTRIRTPIAGFWLGGVAATYQRWDAMLLKYFQDVLTYVRTGEESQLKATVLTDFAAPYLSRAQSKRRTPEQFASRLEPIPRGIVPAWVRFLTAAIDVQAKSFRANVMGWGVRLESCIIDRFSIEVSTRRDGEGRQLGIDPASYSEDWEPLIGEVLNKSYPVESIGDFELHPRLVVCDSGGKDGVTSRAYDFWRSLKRRGMADRFRLIKGDSRPNGPRTQLTWPDNRGRSDRNAWVRGDVPVVLLNTNMLKDGITNDLGRDQPGPGYVHLPDWLDDSYFMQMTAEVRNDKGVWENSNKRRNEDFDLHVYNRAACIVLNAEKINWDRPPEWATDLVTRRAGSTTDKRSSVSVSDLARALNG